MDRENELLQSLHKAVLKLKKTQLEFDSFKKHINEPIAIIGMSCRFPGGANDVNSFWHLLAEGGDGISEVPKERWDVDFYYDRDPDAPGKMYVRSGGFLGIPIDAFDASFFGISPREAIHMDPQQRLLLEVTWEALENASINPLSLSGTKTGVFLGICSHDYADLLSGAVEDIDMYLATGNAGSILAGRLSYFLGLKGPSVAVDSACSSSLFALHSACKSLQNCESQFALAGGVNIILNPAGTIAECKSHMLSKDGYCKTFDADADGFVRGEGCGIVVLKRLSDAIRDQDRILGIIRTTAVNQDGTTSGLTAPNGESQSALIRTALAQAEIEPSAIDYIETHGTGTRLGDPIEIGAIGSIFSGRKDNPLWISSVKTNFGHLEAAAGIAGVIKTVLALNHEAIPPHLHFKQLNPHISLDSIPARIPLALTPWPRSNRPRIAGVSSFGFSGTNVHIIIEEPPLIEQTKNAIDRPWHLLTLSAKNEAALEQLVELYAKQLPDEDLADIAFTANTGRAHFPQRITLIAQTREELLNHLKAGEYLMGQVPANPPKVAFLFTGQKAGSHELMETSPVFREAMERSLGLYEYALFELWKSWGVIPYYVAGEGEGDVIAAIAAGIITLDEGLKLLASKETAYEISYHEPKIRFLSSWTGEVIRQEGLTADYWKPHGNIRKISEDTLVISPQRSWKELLQTLSHLYLNGVAIDWKAFDHSYHRKKVILPTYPFQRERYWVEQLLTKRAEAKAASWLYELIWQPKPLEDRNTEFRIQNSEVWLSVSEKEDFTFEELQSKTVKHEEALEEVMRNSPTHILWDVSGKDSLKEILSFVQALVKIQIKPLLIFITHGIQPVGPITDLENAPFNGFYKTLKLEVRDLECCHIDIGPLEIFPLEELHATDQEDQIAYHAGIRFVPKLLHVQDKQLVNKIKIDPSGSYLITGGLGGLGQKVAEWLAQQGAKHLVLVGRRPSQKIEISGADVETAAVDVSQRAAVDNLMQKFGSEWPELKGIVHAAGVPSLGTYLPAQDWNSSEKAMAPKIKGSWNLHEASLGKPLDFFILFSSLSSVLGLPRGSEYASGNAYMDALAYFRHEKGLPALSISWGPWSEIGMASKLQGRVAGQAGLKPNEGIKALELALNQSNPHLSIVDMDWKQYPHRQQLFLSELIPAKEALLPILLIRLTDAVPSERKEILTHYLQETIGKILGERSLNLELGFFEAGMDSLMAIELYNKLQADMGTLYKFPTTLVFDNPNILRLIHYFEEHIFPLIGIKPLVQKAAPTPSIVKADQIAIIGLSCRFPGGANDPQTFWELLKQGQDGITEVPPDRWEIDSLYDPEAHGKMYVRSSGFLTVPIDRFDAHFFGISPREAEYMDPQQRLLLEVTWEALENACINPLSLKGSQTGVFIGLSSHDYSDFLIAKPSVEIENFSIYAATGNSNSILAGRVSYFFGLHGPCLVIDTACSSSLVALDSACKSLQMGTSQIALAGGVNLILNPTITIALCEGHLLAKDGHCKTFDAEADGYVRSEGCGVVVLKRLSDAIRDQDPILGIIKATAVNQDGATAGLTVPNGESQIALIRTALGQAELDPQAIDYIETHGVGTTLGDPIEIGALSAIFSGRKDPLLIGTVKTNIGHLEAAAGIAGLVKTVLALQHEAIPSHLHFKKLNPHISLETIPAQIPLTLTPWPRSNRPRIAGVSSFGFSGTNAHAIIEEPPIIEQKKNEVNRPWHLLTLSAKSQTALDQLISLYTKQMPSAELADIAFTANTGRAHFLHRITLIAQNREEMLNHLQTGEYWIGQAPSNTPKVTFLFTGQKVETRELFETSPLFKEAMERSQGLYEYALFELWKSWGIIPDYVSGEGESDVVAAIASGIITLEEGLKLLVSKGTAQEISYREPQIGFLSSWTGEVLGKESLTADYWKPHESIRNIPEGTLVISTQSNWKNILERLSQLYLNGVPIDWKGFDKSYNRIKVSLPTYPFQREHYWIEGLNVLKKRHVPTESLFYQIRWQPKPLDRNTEFRIQNSEDWLLVSDQEEQIEGLEYKRTKPEQAVTEMADHLPARVLWFVSGLKSILSFVQTLATLETKPLLYFVTHGIQPVNPIADLENAPFNGFYKTLLLEMPTLVCRHIDLAPGEKFPVEELLAANYEPQVAYAEGIRYVPMLMHQDIPHTQSKIKIDPASSYLITGGLGGLGLKVAEWLAQQGAKHLVLVGRRASQKIEIPHVTVETAAIDISQKLAVNALLQKFGTDWPELKGIIHSAGVLGNGNYLPSQDWSQFEKVCAPKIQGSWIVHEASLTKPLDFFVLFSSLSSVLGLPRASEYAAANSYMDALAHFRHERGLPALAISWGPWSDVGMSASMQGRKVGQAGLKPEDGIKALEMALTQTHPHVSVVDMDWKSYPHKQKFLSELIPAKSFAEPILFQRLTEALPSERRDILTDYLQRTVGKIIGINSFNPEIGFFEAGMDSLMTEELYEKLQADIGGFYEFPSTIAFDHPSVLKLTQYFEEHIFPLIGIKAIVKKTAPAPVTKETDQIAIIGLSCRFPGGANQPQAFWELLKQGHDSITEIPPERWDIDAFYDPDPEAPGKMYVRRGSFLNTSIDAFDANFFGISPREAEYMDPQQRLLLEVAWEALENACIDPLSLNGLPVGVFIGVTSHDYADLMGSLSSLDDVNAYMGSGNVANALAGRLSYFLGLQGPCLSVDTACSSSLVALNCACKSLQDGECQSALAGGVNLILNPAGMVYTCKAHMLSKDGYCKTFDAEADGFARGEGCGMVVLKRLSDAIRDKDPIFGIIRATEVNQDGTTSGFTVPNGEAQTVLIRQALAHAELDPYAIDYIEAHGTGTSLGDPIEVGALKAVFNGRKDHPLWIGAVKTNIGHLEAAAGVAGVIKLVLALNHEAIPPHLHFKQLNPRISLDSIPAKIPLTLTPWQRSTRPRIAGVSSFGVSGTNAHAIIEEPPLVEYKKNAIERPWHILTLSAKTPAALDQLIDLYVKQLPEEELANITFTANTGRAHFPHRVTVLAQTREELLQHLKTGEYLIRQIADKPPKILLIFTGQTFENAELMLTSPIFKEAMERSQGLYEYAFFELLKSWGFIPDYVAGNGIGDIIAAIVAEIITLEDGLKLIGTQDNPAEQIKIANEIQYREPQIGFISSWTGEVVRKEGLPANYWKPHEQTNKIPENALAIPVPRNWKGILETLSQLYLHGISIDWKAFDKPYSRKKVSLPTYPFQRERYWAEGIRQINNMPQSIGHKAANRHPFLIHQIDSFAFEGTVFETEINTKWPNFIKDHQLYQVHLVAGATYLSTILSAAKILFNQETYELNAIEFVNPLILPAGVTQLVQTMIHPLKNGQRRFEIVSQPKGEKEFWTTHVQGFLNESKPLSIKEGESLTTIQERCHLECSKDQIYQLTQEFELALGPHFRWIEKVYIGENELLGQLRLPTGEEDQEYILHPGFLDSCFQTIFALLINQHLESKDKEINIPFSIGQVSFDERFGRAVWVHARYSISIESEKFPSINFTLLNAQGYPIGQIVHFTARPAPRETLLKNLSFKKEINWLYKTTWIPKPLEAMETKPENPWLIISEKEQQIEGLQCKVVKPEQAVAEIAEHPSIGVLWFVSGGLRQVLGFVQAISNLPDQPTLIFITRGIQPVGHIADLENAPFNGFFKTLRLELPTLNCRHIDLPPTEKFPIKELLASDQEDQVAYWEGVRYVPRLVAARNAKHSGRKLMTPMAPEFHLVTSSRGSLENLYLNPNHKIPEPGPREITVEVKAAALNFRDVLNAMGLYPGEMGPLGGECAGIVTSVGKDVTEFKLGDRVVGLARGSFASSVANSADLFTRIPSQLSFAEAASMPAGFLTAYYALVMLAKLKAGEKLLVHAAAGGVGLAAIQVAQQIGAEIFATASTPEKQNYLRTLGISHIYNSRTLDFAKEMEGMDVVLNSLTGGGFIAKSVSVCSQGARFIEIGKRNIWTKEAMHKVRPDVEYHILDLDEIFLQTPLETCNNLLKSVIAQFKPLPCTCFPITEAEAAFEYLQRAKNIGKVILKMPENKPLKIDPTASYLITGGFGGLGFKVAEWLAKQGATHLVLAGRTTKQIDIPNATVVTVAIDISQKAAVEALMQRFGTKWPELKGIIHAAGVIDDGVLNTQDWSRFEKVFAPKVQGSWNLHEASLAKPLDFFVLFSSVASSLGSPAQINYASANAYMDALAFFRQEKRLPALAISWGPWSEIGMAANLTERHRAGGLIAFKPDEGIKALELALTQTYPHLSIANVDWKRAPSQPSLFLSELITAKSTEGPILLQRLTEALPSERQGILIDYLQLTVGKILGISSLNPELGFFEAGMDSLMAVELRNKLQADIGKIHLFPPTIAFDNPSVVKLVHYFEEYVFPLIGIKAITHKASSSPKKMVEADRIAIIGMSCRFPGGANDPEAFWELLKRGYDAVSEVPSNRWDIDTYYDPDPNAPGKMYMRRCAFLNTPIDTFDAQFFGISPREAEYMDPQQRLLLEVSWEALENACIDPLSLKDSATGVFIGLSVFDYSSLIFRLESIESINPYIATGNVGSATAGRLSYFFGLQGPCMAVDTACSSSHVALNYACKSLQTGECRLALVGGAQLLINPGSTIGECKAHMLAPDGYCKTFDADADGFARGEGCGVVLLKRLSDAIQDRDPIFGVIRGTSVNQDGATSGFTVPNRKAQTSLITSALAKAELDPIAIDYIEAHGTGTSLGDPIEIGALTNVFHGRDDHPLLIGSVKTNIGHLEAAAGIAGLIKTVLALNHEAIPPHLHLKQLNPHISLDAIPAQIPLELTPWLRSNRPRIAGVSSFGFSGINAHAIIEEAPIIECEKNASDRSWHLLTLSAKTETALDQLVSLYSKKMPEEEFADIAFTANTGRAHFPYRATLIAQTREELLDHLNKGEYLTGKAPETPAKVAFLFTGKKGDSHELMETSPIFKEAIETSQGLYEYALFELWKSWGVAPDYVLGENDGDVMAAIAAGIITLEEGLKLIASKEIAEEIRYREPQIGFLSSWTGEVIRKEGITADYWKPHELIRNFPKDALIISTQTSWKELLQTLSHLYLNGVRIDWKSFDKPYHRKKISLPTYPFQREHYWVEQLLEKQVGLKTASWFYQINWLPKPLENTEVGTQNKEMWLVVSQRKVTIKGLQSKTINPEEVVEEIAKNPTPGVLWIASGDSSLKQILPFIQALGQMETPPPLFIITQGIQPIGPITDLENATFNGFFRTLKLEMTQFDCRHIDLGPEENLPIEELFATDCDEQVAYRKGIRYVPKLSRMQNVAQNQKKIKIDPTGSYLVTGGLRGIGLKVAEWLAKQGAKHLVLVARRAPEKIEFPNATVETAAVDISQRSAVDDLMQKFGSEWPELKGIIHAAGIAGEGIYLQQQDWSHFEKVFAAKVQGSRNLHEASLNKLLDFFVLFSSLSSVLGLPRGSDYASANAYMDALAYMRHEKGLPALAISWGPWAEIGMGGTAKSNLAAQVGLNPNEGIKALELALNQNNPHLAIVDIDWKRYPHQQLLLSELIPAKTEQLPTLLIRLTEVVPSKRKEILTHYLQETVGKILGQRSLDLELGFFDAGMDSLMAVELYNKLQADIGTLYKFPSTLAFDNPNILKLVYYFEEHIFPLIGIKPLVQKGAPTYSIVKSDQIAIIGLSCRFPGGANDPDSFWQLLSQGYDGIVEIPKDRWDIEEYYDPDPAAPGKMYVRRSGFLNRTIDTFDAQFFGISPREANYMDPQQRLLLEVAWEALENACIDPTTLNGSLSGVFIGISAGDYSTFLSSLISIESINAYIVTGNSSSAAAGRLSYFLGLQGPSLAIDTACSSSLVALNYACKSLQNGECHLALSGGVNLMINPGTTVLECKSQMLSKDGYCKTFDAKADGFVRGEGCGMIVLKRLSDALQNRDPILGIIRATSVNQDGASAGFTVPNGEAQTALIRSALAQAELDPKAVDYIEAHGVGTVLGDPIELRALSSIFSGRKDHPLWIGSVKTNIGHLESAAGVAGVIKTVLSLTHDAIPPHLHFKQLNPHISLDSIPAKIPLTLTPWLRSNRPRIAGVSSFGFSGTNAHVIIEEPPVSEQKKNEMDRPWHILTLSAKTPAALDQLINCYIDQLPQENLADIAFTANTGRAHFPHRITLVAQTRDELLKQLETGDYWIGEAPPNPRPVVFLFSERNTESPELWESSTVFREAVERSQGLYEYALFELCKSWGILPDYVAGKGIGDIIAAIAAGIISLEDSLKLITSREDPAEQSKTAENMIYHEPQNGFLSSWTGETIHREGISSDYWKPHENVRNIPEGALIITAQSTWKELLQSLSQLYLNGISVDWKAFDKSYNRKKVTLPNYPFQREHYWFERKVHKARRLSAEIHPVLGELIPSPSEEKLFRNEIDLAVLPYLEDHKVYEQILFPGAGFAECLLAAGGALFQRQTISLLNFVIEQPLALNRSKSTPIELLAKPREGAYEASIHSLQEQTWVLHAKGELTIVETTPIPDTDWKHFQNLCQKTIDPEFLYSQLDGSGLHYGKQFQTIKKIKISDKDVIAELESDTPAALLDGSFQTLAPFVNKEDHEAVYIPYKIDQITQFSELETYVCVHTQLTQGTENSLTANIDIFSLIGKLLMQIEGFHARKTTQQYLHQLLTNQTKPLAASWLYQIDWLTKPLEKTEEQFKSPWFIVSGKEEIIEGLPSRSIKPEEAVEELIKNPSKNILWMASGDESLKQALPFVQALSKLPTQSRFCLVTHGIQPIGSITDLPNAPFNGFYRTLKLELPNLDCRHMDLAPNEKFPVQELFAEDHEWQVAYREGIRYVARLKLAQRESQLDSSEKRIKIDPDGSYLITGGLGGLGLKVAEWLVKQGAKHLVLAGRKTRQIEIADATVITAILDVAQRQSVDELMHQFGNAWPELKGIIHAAGVIDDAIFSSQDWSRFESVFASKVKGSWNLHEASLSKPLDFFVLFSSFAALGSPGQINYASANAYMDALAYFRYNQGLPALSISWGPWSEVGLAANLTERHRAKGVIPFNPKEGIETLEVVLTQAKPHIIAAKLDRTLLPTDQSFLDELIVAKPTKAPRLLERLLHAPHSQRKDIITNYLQKNVCKILGTSSLNPELGFFESGMDSLMTEELYEKLQGDIGQKHRLPSTVVFDYPSINKMTNFILNILFPEQKEEHLEENLELVSIEKEVSTMTLEEVDKMLDRLGDHYG